MNVKTYQRFTAGKIAIVLIQPPKNIIVAIIDVARKAFVRKS